METTNTVVENVEGVLLESATSPVATVCAIVSTVALVVIAGVVLLG